MRYIFFISAFFCHLLSFAQLTEAYSLDFGENLVSNPIKDFQVIDYNGDSYLDFCQISYDDEIEQSIMLITENLFERKFITKKIAIPVEFEVNSNTRFYDYDGNGLVDLLKVTNYGSVQLLLQISPDEFAMGTPNSQFPTLNLNQVFDYNSDGIQDLFLADYDSLAVLTNDGAGNLNIAASFSLNAPGGVDFDEMIWRDYDGDDDKDLISVFDGDGLAVDFYLRVNDSTDYDTSWTLLKTFYNGYIDLDWKMADFDNDDTLDIAISNNVGFNIYIQESANQYNLQYSENDIENVEFETIDFDGDGDIDITCSDDNPTYASFIPNNGDGSFPPTNGASGYDPYFIHDFDNDGLKDIFLINTPNIGGIRWNNGGGNFSSLQIVVSHYTASKNLGIHPNSLGGLSFYTSNDLQLRNYLNCYNLKHNGDLEYEYIPATFSNFPNSEALPVHDFDNDGMNDLIYYIRQQGNVGATFHFRKGNNEFFDSPVEIFFLPFAPNQFGSTFINDYSVCDQDQDGDLDLLIIIPGNDDVLYFVENIGNGFAPPTIVVEDPYNNMVDIENDGDIDLLGINQMYLYENGEFTAVAANISNDANYYQPAFNPQTGYVEFYDVPLTQNTEQNRRVRHFKADSLGYYSYVEYPVNDHPSLNALVSGNFYDQLVVDIDNDSILDILYAQQNLLITLHGTGTGFEITEDAFILPSSVPLEILAYDFDEDTDQDIFISFEGGYINDGGWFIVENHLLEPQPDPLDLNGDGSTDTLDLLMLIENFGCANVCNALDLDQDGLITAMDITIFLGGM